MEWTENSRDRQGIPKKTARMRALLTVYTVAPSPDTTEEQIRRKSNWSPANR